MTPGIYGIWAADRSRIYVGSTGNIEARLCAHRPAVFLGCEIEVGMSLPDSTRSERNKIEDRIILALRGRGITVANPTNAENHLAHLRHTPEQYREHARMGLGRLTPAQRSENGRKGALALTTAQRQSARAKLSKEAVMRGAQAIKGLSSEQRRINGLKGADARWRKET